MGKNLMRIRFWMIRNQRKIEIKVDKQGTEDRRIQQKSNEGYRLKWESIHKKKRWHKAKRPNSCLKIMECFRVNNTLKQSNTILNMKKVSEKSFKEDLYALLLMEH
jgi:hypothetical protein